ncbi:MAG: 50S ribosomal protein L9 [Deltaproteobacteria bacterium]|jgi:large subunit ribosomal protein L9|nr:50S ribosomal protein L9 [Deltaproteobacteria bacterium]
MAVKVILREDVENLGDAGDVVAVKPGYARNFLIPTGKAIVATRSKISELEHHQRVIAEKQAKQLKDLRAAKDRLEGLSLEISAQAGEEGKLFGSVTSAQIAALVAEKGMQIDRRKIELAEPIKELGEHEVPVKLHREVIANLKVSVTASAGE